jgi:hypothetical protein
MHGSFLSRTIDADETKKGRWWFQLPEPACTGKRLAIILPLFALQALAL